MIWPPPPSWLWWILYFPFECFSAIHFVRIAPFVQMFYTMCVCLAGEGGRVALKYEYKTTEKINTNDPTGKNYQTFDNNEFVWFDLTEAFATINGSIIPNKLASLSMTGLVNEWFRSYLWQTLRHVWDWSVISTWKYWLE